MNLIQSLRRQGQSVWLDGFERGWISQGELQHTIDDGVRGVLLTFEGLKLAIQGQEYDRDFSVLTQQAVNRTARSDYDYIVKRDLQLAADLLKQVHSQTQGREGYVQVDFPPHALLQAETAIAEAQKIWQEVGWQNLMLRIPATPIMLPVIEQLIGDRINVNVTFVFSQRTYEQVFDVYLSGLERLIHQGESANDVVCFTSFSIGRLDAALHPLTSFGITQAEILYQHFQNFCQNARWKALRGRANPLRLVWDCTDIQPQDAWRYIQVLAFPGTAILLSKATLEMYQQVSLLPMSVIGSERVEQMLTNFPLVAIPLDELVDRLVDEEMTRSLNAFDRLLDEIAQKLDVQSP
ncbi:transaldolase family protein [Nostoc sp.]|uniref:transaldolase family protein n=1 Tax=Nostoc sp. TaxID=1180 RepID=UPI002FF88CDA